jgi:glyoxylase-like metal-dependent hydrolase (beta-lactamase superfamily II)
LSLPYLTPLGDGIFAIDTGFYRPNFDAAYLIVENGRAAFVDCGTNFAVPRLLATLTDLGLGADAVDLVIPTHVHLDHAGGAGLLMQSLPNATAWVHPRGARHLIDPTALYQGALAVYGQAEMDRSYGHLVGIPAARVQTSADGLTIQLAGRQLEFADTPGHARHHHCLWDERSRGWFTGDTFGLSYREFDTAQGPWIMPTSTPVQFEPALLRESVRRLLARDPAAIYLTHYSRVTDVARLGAQLLAGIDQLVEIGLRLRAAPQRHAALCAALADLYRSELERHGVADFDAAVQLLALDVELNAQGIAIWLDREPRDAATASA